MELPESLHELDANLESRIGAESLFPCVLHDAPQIWTQFPLHCEVVPARLYRPRVDQRREVTLIWTLILRDLSQHVDFELVDQFVALSLPLAQANILLHKKPNINLMAKTYNFDDARRRDLTRVLRIEHHAKIALCDDVVQDKPVLQNRRELDLLPGEVTRDELPLFARRVHCAQPLLIVDLLLRLHLLSN